MTALGQIPELNRSYQLLKRANFLFTTYPSFQIQDYEFLYKSGAAAIFGPGTKLPVAALDVVNLVSAAISPAPDSQASSAKM